jgi:hypothetical protein
MGKYVHEKKKLHISRRRRKDDGAISDLKKDKAGTDRRREKERVGIILQDHDRRQKKDPKYSDREKRSGKERRSGKDRRG